MLGRLAAFLLILAPLSYANDHYTQTKEQTWDFSAGGRIELHLSYGDLKVWPADDNHISLRYTMQSEHADFIPRVTTKFDVTASSAVLRISGPHDGSIDVELKVPARSNLHLRVSAGDIVVGPIEGDKNVETHAGDIVINLPEHFDVGAVDASTHAGDVSAPWGKPHGWIGNSLKYAGDGKYSIHAHTFAGDIDLKEAEGMEAQKCPCD